MSVLVETTIGDFVIDLFTKERPRTCLNFLKLCKVKHYNFCLFHSIETDFVAQTGDPSGSGKGGESIFRSLYGDQARYFDMETIPKLVHKKRGTVSMINNGEDGHGSQFFITLAESLDYLNGKHTVFGEIGEGFETIEKLNSAICDESNRPYKEIRIIHTVLLHDPYDDPPGLEEPSRSPSPSPEFLKSTRLAIDEDLNPDAGKSVEQVHEEIESKEAKARAHILEMIGDLHHADEKPPDNVLFVCKLNPLTTEEDLMVIFSRFGPIKDCEVIKDKKSGNSLQYAFVEFEQPEHCENAYFQMDNVLIDDRRIHVDFSQSVAKNPKYQWQKQTEQQKPRAIKREPPVPSRKRSSPPVMSTSRRRQDRNRDQCERENRKRSRSRSRKESRSRKGEKSRERSRGREGQRRRSCSKERRRYRR